MAYDRSTYVMRTFTITVPSVSNDGAAAPYYLEKVRAGLEEFGFTGWTETSTTGYWLGMLEPGTVITLYVPDNSPADVALTLGAIGRQAMPDQIAIQVTVSGDVLTLIEA